MKKNLYLFVLVVGLLLNLKAQASLTEYEVLSISEKFKNDTTSEIWISKNTYLKGDSILLWSGEIICPYDTALVVFVDKAPLQNWAHECLYLFLDKTSGNTTCIQKTLPPRNLSKLWIKYRTSNLMRSNRQQSLNSADKYLNVTNRIQSRNTNPNLYAIIVNFCGLSQEYYNERLWNDCSAIYTTLKDHGYLSENIYVAMPNDAEEFSDNSSETGYASLNFGDLDGDGMDDIDFPATTNGLRNLFAELSSVIQEQDILFVYLTGHGSFTVDLQGLYVGFLQDDRYLDDELIRNLVSLPAEIQNIVVQRTATTYLESQLSTRLIQASHKVVCSYARIGFEESSGLIDEYTDRLVNSFTYEMPDVDLNSDGHISMYEAHIYALDNNSGLQDSYPLCLKDEINLDGQNLENTCIQSDLFIKDNIEDFGQETNLTTEYAYISPDIWIEDLGGNIITTCLSNETYNVCVRIKNRGNITNLGNEILHLHWCKGVIGGKWPDSWINGTIYDCEGTSVNVGGQITPEEGINIPSISAYSDTVIRIPWNTPNNNDYISCVEFQEQTDLWHYCLLARIYDEHAQPGADMQYQPLGEFVLNSNNVASKNITIMTETEYGRKSGIVGVIAPYTGIFNLDCRVEAESDAEYEAFLYMSSNLTNSWNRTGTGFEDFGERIQIESRHPILTNFYLDENVLYTIKFEVESINTPNFILNVTLVDENGEHCGGESLRIIETDVISANENRRISSRNSDHPTHETNIYELFDNIIPVANDSTIEQLMILNFTGQVVLNKTANFSELDISDLPTGMYTMIIRKSSSTYSYKFSK